jgi:uncharacterized protein (DUF1800 family)
MKPQRLAALARRKLAIDTAPLSAPEASRLLRRMTHGPTLTEIAALTGTRPGAWVDAQLNMPVSRSAHLTCVERGEAGRPGVFDANSNSAKMAEYVKLLIEPDVLRNRVVYGLLRMLVISRVGNDWCVANYGNAMSAYYDTVANNAFGSFRSLIEGVSRSLSMALYLSHFRNQKASPGREPDENFAREIMQLFTIGLVELNLDGTRVKAGELPISDPRYVANSNADVDTYTNADIKNVARVFTGLCMPNASNAPDFNQANPALFGNQGPAGWASPMVYDPAHHESSLPKVALQGRINIAADVGGDASMAATLDALTNHPSTAPFFCGRMIRIMVTSNPSPEYVARVASVFRNDGTGAVGNLKAVFRAMFLDQEVLAPASKGLISRPRDVYTHICGTWRSVARTADASGGMLGQGYQSGQGLGFINPDLGLGLGDRSIFGEPSVFGIVPAMFAPSGPIKSEGKVAPELALYDTNGAGKYANIICSALAEVIGNKMTPDELAAFPETAAMPLLPALIDKLDLLYCADQCPQSFKTGLFNTVQAVDYSQRTTFNIPVFYRSIAAAMLCSPYSLVQN